MMNELVNRVKYDKLNIFRITEISNGVSSTRNLRKAGACLNCYSVAKVFTATAIGMLQDSNLLNTNTSIYEIFKDEFPEKHDPKWHKVTVEHALLHKIGFASGFLDIDVEDIYKYDTDDFLDIVLRKELAYEPGTNEIYSDAAFYLLSRVVTKVSGERLDDFLQTRLFTPLEFQEVAWSHCPRGHAMGATGLYIRTEDMAKLGQLYLDGGVRGVKRILSFEWISQLLMRGYELRRLSTKTNSFMKGGMDGQVLYLNFDTGTVIAWHACDNSAAMRKIYNLLI